jgi:hypothetical protein
MPCFQAPSGMSKQKFTLLKKVAFNKCLDEVLSGMKKASKDGVVLKDPWGVTRHVFPFLLSYVADEPETKLVACVKGGNSAHPCEQCLVSRHIVYTVCLSSTVSAVVVEGIVRELNRPTCTLWCFCVWPMCLPSCSLSAHFHDAYQPEPCYGICNSRSYSNFALTPASITCHLL